MYGGSDSDARVAGPTGASTLDLSDRNVRAIWDALGVGGAVTAMERCESWAVDARADQREVAESLVREVCDVLNSSTSFGISKSVGRDPSSVIDFMGFLRSGRALALFEWLSRTQPSVPAVLINEARRGGDDYGFILIERIQRLERLSLLSRVFAPERIAMVMELLAEAGLISEDE